MFKSNKIYSFSLYVNIRVKILYTLYQGTEGVFYKISMQIYLYDVFAIRLFSFACYYMISYFMILLSPFSLLIVALVHIFAYMTHMILPMIFSLWLISIPDIISVVPTLSSKHSLLFAS
jgi:hypothetical protein